MKVDETTTTANVPTFVVPVGKPIPYHDYYAALRGYGAKKRKKKNHPLVKWDELMKKYPNASEWYLDNTYK